MNGNHMKKICFLFHVFFMSITIVLIVLLFFEYNFFCKQIQELRNVKAMYLGCINDFQKKIGIFVEDEKNESHEAVNFLSGLIDEQSGLMIDVSLKEESDEVDNDDDYIDDSFLIINRHPDYLKQSTIDYLQLQNLEQLASVIDAHNHIDQKNISVPKKEQTVAKSRGQKTLAKKMLSITYPLKDMGFIWPIDTNKFWLSSLFGARRRINGTWGFHHGIDMAAVKGTIVKTVCAGKVIEAGFRDGYGNTVVIEHSNRVKTRYAHLHSISVRIGQSVKQGMAVGTVGDTGFIRKKGKDGSHLHFEVYENGKRINPLQCLPRF